MMCLIGISCTKQDDMPTEPKLIFRFTFDSTQTRLNAHGVETGIQEGHAAQSPVLNSMSVNYIELSPDDTTSPGQGPVIYRGDETKEGGSTAIDFTRSVFAGNNEVFYAISLKEIPPGEYKHLRLSVACQHFSVQFHIDTTINDTVSIKDDFRGTMASFIGYNTYLTTYNIKNQSVTVDENREQGYWALESTLSAEGFSEDILFSGQAPAGATTVVNPLFDTSPIPEGSDIVTAAFASRSLVISGDESSNVIVEVSISTNKSFEWKEVVHNGKWDILEEPVIDMGVRGMIPVIR